MYSVDGRAELDPVSAPDNAVHGRAGRRVEGTFKYQATHYEYQSEYVLLVHGFRQFDLKKRVLHADTCVKRMWHMGFRGRVGLFTWPCTNTEATCFDMVRHFAGYLPWVSQPEVRPAAYNNGDMNAWRAGVAMRDVLTELNAEFDGAYKASGIRVFAHSQGSIPACQALMPRTRSVPSEVAVGDVVTLTVRGNDYPYDPPGGVTPDYTVTGSSLTFAADTDDTQELVNSICQKWNDKRNEGEFTKFRGTIALPREGFVEIMCISRFLLNNNAQPVRLPVDVTADVEGQGQLSVVCDDPENCAGYVVLTNAAIQASAFSSGASITQYRTNNFIHTPDVFGRYPGWGTAQFVKRHYFKSLDEQDDITFSRLFLEEDLPVDDAWEYNQANRPGGVVNSSGYYEYTNRSFFNSTLTEVRRLHFPDDAFEIFSYAAQGRRAVGTAQSIGGVFADGEETDLEGLTNGDPAGPEWHSLLVNGSLSGTPSGPGGRGARWQYWDIVLNDHFKLQYRIPAEDE